MRIWMTGFAAMMLTAPVHAMAWQPPDEEESTDDASDETAAEPALEPASTPTPQPAARPRPTVDMVIADLWKDEGARAILLRHFPPMSQYVDQVGTMTLAQVAPQSQGAINDENIRQIAAEFAALN